MAKKKTTKTVEVATKPTIKAIPTGILPEEIVETLPEVGEENKVYRRLVEDESLREMQITDDFIWYDGEWHEFSFDAKIFGAYFARFQQSLNAVLADHEARIEALESGTQYVVVVDVSNYTAPNNTPLPTESPFVWDGAGYICEAEGLLADGVPTTVKRIYTMNDTDVVLVLDNDTEVDFYDYQSRGDSFTTKLYGQSNEVTFEHLVLKYEIYE